MNLDSLKFYSLVSRWTFPKTYPGKIMLVAFIGTHIPLIVLIIDAAFSSATTPRAIVSTLIITLIATLVGTAATLYAIHHLLSPVVLTSKVLRKYLKQRQRTNLPNNFQDEVGTLMADTNRTLGKLDEIIEHLTDYDSLTGLPNRELFQTHLQQAIQTTAEDQQFALIVLDIDSLKEINSTLGRIVGDLLLRKVAQRIISYIEPGDVVARFGGDEFAILRTNIINSDSAIILSNRLLESLSEPFSLYGKEIHCAAKIGITIYPFDGTSIEQLLQNADTAIHQAKQESLNTYQFYSPAINAQLKRILAIKENLRHALKRQELSIYYQPRIEIATSRLVAVEALLRWQNPELGFVSPAEFIPIAEETNLIMPIGEWVLYNACLQNKRWQQEGIAPLRMSVNLSIGQFKQTTLIETIDRILRDTNLDVAYLELEITESLLVKNVEQAIAILRELKKRGISIALDDFGTGYSSLSYLQKLPIDTLKIDRSFVTNIASNPDDAAISKAIVALAQSLELNITAEGVETKAQYHYLQNQGCHEVQGYYFSKPLPSEQLKKFVLSYCGSR
ncbi:EAL domain-containing protein [Pleurocapsales cyanobacterium LEGE 10410]|nr:EAL domain-containing protein [Pleurocapsales cyanobacterium LEGE 10410]